MAASPIKVGDKFKLFKKGSRCKVTAVKNGTIRFDISGQVPMTGSFPIALLHEHR